MKRAVRKGDLRKYIAEWKARAMGEYETASNYAYNNDTRAKALATARTLMETAGIISMLADGWRPEAEPVETERETVA